MTEPDLVLHLGLPAACPADLPRALASLRPQLREHGVGYLGDGDLGGLRGAAGAVARARQEAGGGLVLVYTEAVLGGSAALGPVDDPVFRPEAAEALTGLIEALGTERVRLSLHVRRQDRLMEQAYVREVLAGRGHKFPEQFPFHLSPVFDFGALAQRLGAAPGVLETVLRPAEVAGAGRAALVDDLLAIVALRGHLDVAALDRYAAPTCSPRGVRVALALSGHLQTHHERDLAAGFVATNFPAGPDENGLLSERTRADILDAYGETNRRLFGTHLPALAADSYADDAATARLAALLAPRSPLPAPAEDPGPPVLARVGGLLVDHAARLGHRGLTQLRHRQPQRRRPS